MSIRPIVIQRAARVALKARFRQNRKRNSGVVTNTLTAVPLLMMLKVGCRSNGPLECHLGKGEEIRQNVRRHIDEVERAVLHNRVFLLDQDVVARVQRRAEDDRVAQHVQQQHPGGHRDHWEQATPGYRLPVRHTCPQGGDEALDAWFGARVLPGEIVQKQVAEISP